MQNVFYCIALALHIAESSNGRTLVFGTSYLGSSPSSAAMISEQSLYDLAKCRFEEAKILVSNNKADGAVYLCGYAIELMLKRRIVRILEWDGFPENRPEFEGKQSFKSHNLSLLLVLSGMEKKIQSDDSLYAKWQIAGAWDSEIRYRLVGTTKISEADDVIAASKDILNFIATQT